MLTRLIISLSKVGEAQNGDRISSTRSRTAYRIQFNLTYKKDSLRGAVADFFIFSDRVYYIHMTELFHQIIDIAKSIGSIFTDGILPPLVAIFKGIGTLFVKILELTIMAVRWIIAKV